MPVNRNIAATSATPNKIKDQRNIFYLLTTESHRTITMRVRYSPQSRSRAPSTQKPTSIARKLPNFANRSAILPRLSDVRLS
jgi:hypothetical protein